MDITTPPASLAIATAAATSGAEAAVGRGYAAAPAEVIQWGNSPGSVVESVMTGVGPVDSATDDRNPVMVISSGTSVV